MQSLLLEAGYSLESAKQQSNTLKGIKEDLKPIAERLEKERDAILEEMIKKRGKAGYSDLIRGLDITTKNMQLLGGKPTDITQTIHDVIKKYKKDE